MHRYIPSTLAQQQAMLATLGMQDLEDLFREIPEQVRLKRALDLPQSHSEMELMAHLSSLAQNNLGATDYTCFLGAGAYDHYTPSIVNHMLLRQEFFTAYTPYQPEISQGTLQAIFEFQSMICELTGLDVSNASVYDGATALAEAALMAGNATRRSEIVVAGSVHPEHRAVLKTYGQTRDIEIREVPHKNGAVDLDALKSAVSSSTAAVLIQSPNFFGVIEDLSAAASIAHTEGALLVASVDPIALGLLKSPGEMGVDIAVGDGQPLGIPLSFGGPYVGFMATTQKLLRNMPGRIVGITNDSEGQRAYVLTMQTREQHIRREKATSNICTNNALIALATTIYLGVMGKEGLREVAMQCVSKSRYAYDELLKSGQFEEAFAAPFFREFVVKSKRPVAELNQALLKHGILGGYDLGQDYPELENHWLVAVTEKRTKDEIDTLVEKAVM
ncbi:MAG: aminomethyl-transferring glycine dehydrogenase subunit GcvPA [Firmicutes bacterium]|nr:aminomethyl-transferring glycine dehydrogenase subunit GcvPA [Dethiobacter sp.]MBS3888895.1 aminomethyl-transferring glycine dehydrogenase subunit GcvPA [Bacillota bacterium]MBS4055647.1 aminomethyl-transferring glycine dehydrogenase subunit GcvPA [Thermaerobacter sp.]